jgi:hypothetical protein
MPVTGQSRRKKIAAVQDLYRIFLPRTAEDRRWRIPEKRHA